MLRPVIGINCDLEAGRRTLGDTKLLTLNPDYARSVAAAGGVPLLLPAIARGKDADRTLLAAQLDAIDGMLLVGGDDMDPGAYGEPPHPRLVPLDVERDTYDLALVRLALERELPILGVCGGMQLLNVALGGSLHQHLPDCAGTHFESLTPVHADPDGEVRTHRIAIEPGTLLREILGAPELVTNSRHHQAVARLGANLRVSARAEDGVIEAIESIRPITAIGAIEDSSSGAAGLASDERFRVGVQWHPEEMDGEPAQARLFAGLVLHAARRTEERRRR